MAVVNQEKLRRELRNALRSIPLFWKKEGLTGVSVCICALSTCGKLCMG